MDETLREDLSDLVFEVRLATGGQALVVLLFEHKSAPDSMTSFQVLRYIVGICDQRRRNGEPLCCVIPIVLYHGERPWNVARNLRELIDVPDALREYIPAFHLPLVDLSQCSDEELRQESLFFAHMMLLKYMLRSELPERLPEILGLLRVLLSSQTGFESFEAILRYLATGTDRISRDHLQAVVRDLLQTDEESIMPTIAEQWIQEGFDKGFEKGIEQGIERGIGQGIEQGIERGIEQGIEKGEVIGRIRALQEFLNRPVDSRADLEKLDRNSLDQLAAQLDEFRRT